MITGYAITHLPGSGLLGTAVYLRNVDHCSCWYQNCRSAPLKSAKLRVL